MDHPDLNMADAAAFHEGWRAGLQAARDAINLELRKNELPVGLDRPSVFYPGLSKALQAVSKIKSGRETETS